MLVAPHPTSHPVLRQLRSERSASVLRSERRRTSQVDRSVAWHHSRSEKLFKVSGSRLAERTRNRSNDDLSLDLSMLFWYGHNPLHVPQGQPVGLTGCGRICQHITTVRVNLHGERCLVGACTEPIVTLLLQGA